MISLQDINKYYITGDKRFHALKDVNLRVKKGEFLGIMGPSGSGKSTLIKVLGLLDKDYKGKYILDGEDTRELSDDKLSNIRNKRIGFVFQDFNLINKLSIKDNIALPMMYQKISKRNREDRVLELLENIDLVSEINKYPSELSGGQQQRISIIRALVNNPDIIIADEPTGALDSNTSREIMDIFNELNKEGITIIVISHDINVAKRSNRIVTILDGELKEEEDDI